MTEQNVHLKNVLLKMINKLFSKYFNVFSCYCLQLLNVNEFTQLKPFDSGR